MKKLSDKSFFKQKSYKVWVIVSALLCLLPIVFGLILYDKIPEMLATHFDFYGNADKFDSKNKVIFLMPIFMSFLTLFSGLIAYYDPFDKRGENKFPLLMKIILIFLPILSTLTFFISYQYSLYNSKTLIYVLPILIGLLFIILGNYMPKNKQNATIGIKTIWALKDEKNWNKVNRLGGYVFIILGLMFIVVGILLLFDIVTFSKYLGKIFIGLILLISFLPSMYSFLLYRNEQKSTISKESHKL